LIFLSFTCHRNGGWNNAIVNKRHHHLFFACIRMAETNELIANFRYIFYVRKIVISCFFSDASLKFDKRDVESIELGELYLMQSLVLLIPVDKRICTSDFFD
jgi:hypothetical protein